MLNVQKYNFYACLLIWIDLDDLNENQKYIIKLAQLQ